MRRCKQELMPVRLTVGRQALNLKIAVRIRDGQLENRLTVGREPLKLVDLGSNPSSPTRNCMPSTDGTTCLKLSSCCKRCKTRQRKIGREADGNGPENRITET